MMTTGERVAAIAYALGSACGAPTLLFGALIVIVILTQWSPRR